MKSLRLGVLISGSGRTLANFLREEREGRLPGRIVVVVSDREGIPGNEIARAAGVPLFVIPSKRKSDEELSREIYAVLDHHQVDLVLLAGFLRRLAVREDYRWRIMNIHPSLLPLFGGRGMYGERVHRTVLERGLKVSGCTVHFVTDELDAGPIILQACVPVLEDDTPESLAARVFAEECRIYPEAVRLYAAGRLRVEGGRVRILPASTACP